MAKRRLTEFLNSLRVRLALVVVLAFIPLIITAFYIYGVQFKNEQENTKDDLRTLAAIIGANEQQKLENAKHMLQIISGTSQGGPSVSASLAEVKDNYPEYNNIVVTDLEGNVAASAAPLGKLPHAGQNSAFQRTLKSGDFEIGSFYLSEMNGIGVISVSYPVKDESGQMIRIVNAEVKAHIFGDVLQEADLPYGATTNILDDRGAIVARDPAMPSWIGKTHPDHVRILAMQGKEVGTYEGRGLDGVDRFYAFYGIGNVNKPGLYLSVGIDKASVFAEERDTFFRNIVLTLLVMLAASAMAFIFADRLIYKPIKKIKGAADLVALGDMEVRTGLAGKSGEIGELAATFDAMVENLVARDELRRQSELTIEQNERRLNQIVETTPAAILMRDASGAYVFANKAAEEMLGLRLSEGGASYLKTTWRLLKPDGSPVPDKELPFNLAKKRMKPVLGSEFLLLTNDGRKVHISINAAPLIGPKGGYAGTVTSFIDITGRVQSERRQASQRMFYERVLNQINDGIWVAGKDDTINYANEPMISLAGGPAERFIGRNIERDFEVAAMGVFLSYYRIAKKSLGKVRYEGIPVTTLDGRKTFQSGWIVPLVHEGHFDGMIVSAIDVTQIRRSEKEIEHLASFPELDPNPIIELDRQGKGVYSNKAAKDSIGGAAEMKRVAKYIEKPVKEAIDALDKSREDVITFDLPVGDKWFEARVHPLPMQQMIRIYAVDMTDRKRLESRTADYAEQMEAALDGTVQAAISITEARDPYTAGHERRVGELAVAIAAEMGFDKDALKGLQVGAALHDIGKIFVPAEILNKPGSLSDTEFSIIKTHPAGGYEILKVIRFPWPVADMALQHQERLDGSGYPAGLKDGEIILESRILAVADVVEAMSSHRPYRAALGIDAALAEIKNNRGTRFDAEVVDIVLRLFKQGFAFSESKDRL